MTLTPKGERNAVLAGIALLFIAGFAWLWWLCERNPNINFLSAHGEAAWIIYPKPPDPLTYIDLETAAAFRRSFQISRVPEKAKLTMRAFKRFEVRINGMPVTASSAPKSNWKDATEFDVAAMLHTGTNEIFVSVFNKKGQPALWLSLDTGTEHINSGLDWDVSLLGSVWRHAWPASVAMNFAKGNCLYGGEYTLDSVRETLPMLLLFAVISSALVYGVSRFIHRAKGGENGGNAIQKLMPRFVIAMGLLWAALFLNNLSWLPHELGYDEGAHAQYIDYIRSEKALPLANQGWEMCQPPLYYIIGAGITSSSRADTESERATAMLRLFGLATGIAHFTVIFLSLRLLFPANTGAQWFGLILAACVPEHLYISQYVTNEFLAAALVTGALYFCLRLLKNEKDSWTLALAIGLCIGAALLTKFTAILATPFIATILAVRIYKQARPGEAGPPVRGLAIVVLLAFAVAGWHYIRVWIHFGTPVVHDWDAVSGFAWWADKGFQTANYFTGFGQSLVQPHYSVFHSFGDGIYSTLWGDSLDGGSATMENRPPWNYNLMTAGFLLALLPTLIILFGFGVCVVRFIRQPEPAWFLLLGVAVATYASLVYMNLKLPYNCNVKAFYAMITLLPMCACGAAGWEVLTKSLPKLSPILYVAAAVWALNAYASFWVRGGSAVAHATRGNAFSQEGRSEDAIAEFKESLNLDPQSVMVRMLLASELAREGNLDESRTETAKVLAEAPENPDALMQSALLQAAAGQLNQAAETTRHLTEVDPDFVLADEKLCHEMMQLGKYHEAAQAAREALRIKPFRAEIHYLLGFSLDAQGEHVEANQHFQLASNLKPAWADAHDKFGFCLGELNQWDAATAEFTEACRLNPDNSDYLLHLSEAYSQGGRFDEAMQLASKGAKLAQSKGNNERFAAGLKMIELYRARQSFHEEKQSGVPGMPAN